jgi:hypothetical protein
VAYTRLATVLGCMVMLHTYAARCSEEQLLTAGQWTAATDGGSFEVYANSLGGRLAFVLPAGSHHFIVRASKDSWHIPAGTRAPLNISFAAGRSFALIGDGEGQKIDAPVPDSEVAAWTHNFTAMSTMTVSFPEGAERPWLMSLAGTTPTIEAMAHAIEVAGLVDLPKPFNPVPITRNDAGVGSPMQDVPPAEPTPRSSFGAAAPPPTPAPSPQKAVSPPDTSNAWYYISPFPRTCETGTFTPSGIIETLQESRQEYWTDDVKDPDTGLIVQVTVHTIEPDQQPGTSTIWKFYRGIARCKAVFSAEKEDINRYK